MATVASLFQSDSEEDWVPAHPVESLGGGEAGPASGQRLSDREPGLGGTPESKESRLIRSEVYADVGSQLWYWQSPQRVEAPAAASLSDPYRPDPKSLQQSDSDCDLEEDSDSGAD